MSGSAGHGKVVANAAVLGAQSPEYEQIHGLRTEIPALAAWTQLSGMDITREPDSKNLIQSVRMTLAAIDPIPLSSKLNLTLRSHWRTSRGPDGEIVRGEFHAYETIELEASSSDALEWDEHVDVHGAVVELVSVVAWRSFGFASIKVSRDEERMRNQSGDDLGARWHEVASHQYSAHEPWAKEPRFLFPFHEVGPEGIERWLKLRETYGAAIAPLLSILRSDRPWSIPSVTQSGIALEQLGHLISMHKNGSGDLDRRGRIHYKGALAVVLNDMAVKPFDDTEGWRVRADDAYQGTKHLDRPTPDVLDIMNTLRENILIMRFWIGLQIGVAPETLEEGLKWDPLAHRFVLAE